jgi:hypothetical protein
LETLCGLQSAFSGSPNWREKALGHLARKCLNQDLGANDVNFHSWIQPSLSPYEKWWLWCLVMWCAHACGLWCLVMWCAYACDAFTVMMTCAHECAVVWCRRRQQNWFWNPQPWWKTVFQWKSHGFHL